MGRWYWFHISSNMIFILLDYDEIHKKQKFSVPDIVELLVNRCGCNFCWHNSTSFFTLMINIFIFRCADLDPYDYYYYFADQLTWHNSPDCLYNKWLSCLRKWSLWCHTIRDFGIMWSYNRNIRQSIRVYGKKDLFIILTKTMWSKHRDM